MDPESPRHFSEGSQYQAVIDRFELAWQEGEVPQILAFLPPSSALPGAEAVRRDLLVELVILDLWYRWRHAARSAPAEDASPSASSPSLTSEWTPGKPAEDPIKPRLLEDYVSEFSELGPLASLPVAAIVEEYRARLNWGSGVTETEYLARFPAHAAELPGRLKAIREEGTVAVRGPAGPPPRIDSLRAPGNLLFGILAMQTDFIDRAALVRALHAWVMAKDRPLGEILVEQKALSADRRTLLEALVQEYLKQHGNDTEKSLAAVSSLGSLWEDLGQFADGEVQSALARIAAARPSSAPGGPAAVGSFTSGGARFRILRPHAEGGLGKVSVARDEELSRDVALKEIKARHADNPDSRARFLLEAEITGGLEHPGIVPVYGLGQYGDGRPYYAMRFIRGDSLKEAVDRYHHPSAGTSAPGERAVELRKLLGRFLDVCNAIAYAHSRGVLHRDLKPGNIMLGQYGETLVVDWGLAKAVDRPELKSESGEGLLKPSSGSGVAVTQMGSALGTPQYMSPEQAAGRLDRLGTASDVYSLGATLYYVLTGKPPVEGNDIESILNKVQQGDIRPPRAVNPEISRPLAAICLKAMRLAPADRYPSPKALADDIERWLADESLRAYRESAVERLLRWGRKHRTLVHALAAIMVIAVVGLATGSVLINAERQRTELQRQRAVALAEDNAGLADREGQARMRAEGLAEDNRQLAEKERALRQDMTRQAVSARVDRALIAAGTRGPQEGLLYFAQALEMAHENQLREIEPVIRLQIDAWRRGLFALTDVLPPLEAESPSAYLRQPHVSLHPRLGVVVFNRGKKVRMDQPWQPGQKPIEREFPADVSQVVLSPQDDILRVACMDSSVHFLNVRGEEIAPRFQDPECDVRDVFPVAGADWALLQMKNGGPGQLRRIRSSALSAEMKLVHEVSAQLVGLSPDMRWAVIKVPATGRLRLFDLSTWQAVGAEMGSHASGVGGPITTMQPEGNLLILPCGQELFVWDTSTGTAHSRLLQPRQPRGDIVLTNMDPSRHWIARERIGRGGYIQSFDPKTGADVGPKLEFSPHIQSIDYNAVARRVAAIDDRGTTTIWNSESGERLLAFETNSSESPSRQLRFASGGEILEIIEKERSQRWQVSPGKPAKLLGTLDKVRVLIDPLCRDRELLVSEDGHLQFRNALSGLFIGKRAALPAGLKPQWIAIHPGKDLVAVLSDPHADPGGAGKIPANHGSDLGLNFPVWVWDTSSEDLVACRDAIAANRPPAIGWNSAGTRVVVVGEGPANVNMAEIDPRTADVARREARPLPGAPGRINFARLRADGRRAVTVANESREGLLWDCAAGRSLRSFRSIVPGLNQPTVSFSPDNKLLAVISETDGLLICNAESGDEIRRESPLRPLNRVQFIDDSHLLCVRKSPLPWDEELGELSVLDAVTGRYRVRPTAMKSSGGAVATADGKRILTWADQRMTFLSAQQAVKTLALESPVIGVNLAADENFFVTWSQDKCVRVWDATSGALVGSSVPHRGELHDAQLNCRAGTLGLTTAANCYDESQISLGPFFTFRNVPQEARTWRLPQSQRRAVSLGDKFAIAAEFTDNSQLVAAVGPNEVPRRWLVPTGAERDPQKFVNPNWLHPHFSPGARYFHGRMGGSEVIMPLGEGPLPDKNIPAFDMPDPNTISVFSGDQRWLAIASNNTVSRFALPTLKPLPPALSHQERISSLAVSSDGSSIAAGTDQGTIIVWDIATGAVRDEGKAGDQRIDRLDFQPRRLHLLAVAGKVARVRDVAGRQWLGKPLNHADRISCAALLASGKVLTCTSGGEADLWQDPSFAAPLLRVAHPPQIESAVISADESLLATGGVDGSVRIWNVATGQPLGPPLGGGGLVHLLRMSPDQHYLCAASNRDPALLVQVPAPIEGSPGQVFKEIEKAFGYTLDQSNPVSIASEQWRRRFSDGAASSPAAGGNEPPRGTTADRPTP